MHKILLLLNISLAFSFILVIAEAHKHGKRRHHGRRTPSAHSPRSPPHSRPHPPPMSGGTRPHHPWSHRPSGPIHPPTWRGDKHGKHPEPKVFNGAVRLLMDWANDYSHLDSIKAKTLIKRFHTAIKKELSRGLIKMKVEKLRKGSVIVEFTFVMANGTANDVRTKLGGKMKTGELGDMKVDKNYLKVDEVEPSIEHRQHIHIHKKGHHHLSLEAKAAIIVLAVFLFCVCIAVGVWFYLKGKKAKKQNEVVQQFDNPIKFPPESVA